MVWLGVLVVSVWMCYKYLILLSNHGGSVSFSLILWVSVCFCLEPLWHIPASTSRGPGGGGGQRRPTRQDVPGKDSPNRNSKVRLVTSRSHFFSPCLPECLWMFLSCPLQGETQYSSHSSSNTLSSNASSGHSDERWFDGGPAGERVPGGCLGDPTEPDPDHLNKGGSNDSGIDASTHYNNTRLVNMPNSHKPLQCFGTYGGGQELSVGRSSGSSGEGRRRESSPIIPAAANQNKGYRTRTFPPPGSSAEKMDAFKPRWDADSDVMHLLWHFSNMIP